MISKRLTVSLTLIGLFVVSSLLLAFYSLFSIHETRQSAPDETKLLLYSQFLEDNPRYFWTFNFRRLMTPFFDDDTDFRPLLQSSSPVKDQNCKAASVVKNQNLRVVNVDDLPNESDVIVQRFPKLGALQIPFSDGKPLKIIVRKKFNRAILSESENTAFFNFSQVQIPTPNPPHPNSSYIALLENTFVGEGGKIYSCTKQIYSRGCVSYLVRDQKTHDHGRHMVTSHKKLAPLVQYWTYGYYHFVTESLSRLGMLFKLLQDDPEIRILVDQKDYVVQYLNLLNVSLSRVVWYNPRMARFAEKLVYVPDSTCGNLSNFL